ncbi:MAG TPA: carbamate kinase [Longimicrobiales bacterium]|nr:carbamate kinase [Longimicrobiales bacterium]
MSADEDAVGTIVVALGGNALQPAGGDGDIHEQFAHARESLASVVELAASGWRIALVHGNGPQIGDDLFRNERAADRLAPLPLGVLVAGTGGWIGYMLQQSLQNALKRRGVRRLVSTLVTQVRVDPEDPALDAPDKPIGRVLEEGEARRLEDRLGWQVRETASGWRRVVASPRPLEIIESEQIRRLVTGGTIVIACGGGGIPVYRDERGLEGVDAVVDKDRAATVLARDIDASELLILTNVEGVFEAFGTDRQRRIERMDTPAARALLASGALGEGSMAPKVESAIDFVEAGGRRATIARLDEGREAVHGTAGTTITESG